VAAITGATSAGAGEAGRAAPVVGSRAELGVGRLITSARADCFSATLRLLSDVAADQAGIEPATSTVQDMGDRLRADPDSGQRRVMHSQTPMQLGGRRAGPSPRPRRARSVTDQPSGSGKAWNATWNDGPVMSCAFRAFWFARRAFSAGRAHGAVGLASCKRQGTSSILVTGSQVRCGFPDRWRRAVG
jgi:hypothetical protein